jgi:hypothetical protein
MPLMTQGEYAKHAKVSQQAISKAVRAGKIPIVDGKIDQEIADRVWLSQRGAPAQLVIAPSAVPSAPQAESAAPTANPPQSALGFVAPPPGTAASAQAELAQARKAKLDFEMEKERGRWVPADEVAEAWGQRIVGIRTRMLSISHEFKDAAVRAQVDRLIREALGDAERLWMPTMETTAA